MSGTKPTPGPWRVEGDALRALVRGADSTIVATRHRLPANVHEANARLIVRAVNCHADLVAALAPLAKIADWHETMLLTDEHTIIGFSGETEHFRLTLGDCRKARAALAKAGETP